MHAKEKEFKEAIALRKAGYSLNEIRSKVNVAKSTLSLWLREVKLSKPQKQRLTRKKMLAAKRGWEKVRQMRIDKTARIKREARAEISSISERDLWFLGIALYWGEGCKEKPHGKSPSVDIMNLDPNLLNVFRLWLFRCCNIPESSLGYEIYIHQGSPNVQEAQNYWRRKLDLPRNQHIPLRYKKHNPKTVRKNINKGYYGLCRIKVKKSTDFNRRIAGWIEGVVENIYKNAG